MIDFEIVDEEMQLVKPVDASFSFRFVEEVAARHPDWRCIPGIDPYGLTLFNQVQVSWLINELDALLGSDEATEWRGDVQSLRDAAEWVSNEVHTYLRSVGD